jgi:1-acyl-sn-glycerol-3-phosphate acyltransferase
MSSSSYRLVRALIRLLLRLFFRRIELVGREHVPAAGPVILAANHHNSVVDAMIVVACVSRPVVVLATAPLFRHPLVGPFLRTMGAVPVHRRAEAGDDPRKNEAMFDAVIAALRAGGVVLIFPEGRTQPQPVLLPLRTGAARILLATDSATPPAGVSLLPVGMVYHDPGTFRAASVQVTIGEPLATADVVATYPERPEEAVRALTARLADAIRARIVEAEDQHTLELLAVLERAWREEAGGVDAPEAALAWKREVMGVARHLEASMPARVAAVRQRVERYHAGLDEVGLSSEQLGRPYTARLVLSYVADNLFWLALGLPLALWGLACHAAPYWLTGRTVRWLDRTAEEEATDKLAVGLVLYPALWAAEGWLVHRVAGGLGLAVFLVLLAPAGVLALAWRERLHRVGRQARAFLRFLADPQLHARLLAERRALVEELGRLAELVPPEVRRS